MKENEVYQAVWRKYLPVIAMKLKQVIRNSGSSHMGMYAFEFHIAGKKKRVGYQFDLVMDKGRVTNDISGSLAACELRDMLKADKQIRPLLATGHFTFSLNGEFIFTVSAIELAVTA